MNKLPLSEKKGEGGNRDRDRGAILIIVLWFIVIVTVIVAALASETRLSAKAVFHNKIGLETWNDTLQALRVAEMELLINRMPEPPGEETALSERKNKRYRFDGRVVDLAYPIPDTVSVRIYDHAGKINLIRLSKKHMRQLLEKHIGNDLEKLDALEDAWQDWIDRDDFKRANGAEKDYYETLDPPYEPRNDRLETVEEFLLIKGFAEILDGVEMDSAFTVYGNKSGVNPNLATREALMLLPGLDEDTVNIILIKRREKEFKSHKDFKDFMEPEQLVEVKPWINFSTGNIYSIAVLVKPPEEVETENANTDDLEEVDEKEEEEKKEDGAAQRQEIQRAYMVTVQPRGFNQFPRILKVNPYGVLPDTRHEEMNLDVEENGGDGFLDQSKSKPFGGTQGGGSTKTSPFGQ